MSRSIHTTRRTLTVLAAEVKAKREHAAEEFKDAWLEFHRKKRIKRSVAAERRNIAPPLVSTAIDAIPVHLSDEAPSVRYGATVDDVRAVLSRLPEAARHGVAQIRLCLGMAEQEEHVAEGLHGDAWSDPVIGRPGGTMIPGVYTGYVLGSFSRQSGLISIYAYVVDPSATLLPEPALNVYMRLSALTTLIHEVAHHHDLTTRVRRGRWLADTEENAENYADKMTRLWTTQILPSYLQETYPNEVRSLLEWVHELIGIPLPLSFFVNETETFLSITYLFGRWMEELTKCPSKLESRLSFAQWIVFANRHNESLAIVDQLLAERDDWLDALVLRAEVLQHLDRFDEAFEQANSILRTEAKCGRALDVRSKILEERQDWAGLLMNADATLQCAEKPADKRTALMFRAVALCALRREAELEQTFATLKTTGLRAPTEEVWARIFRRAGREMRLSTSRT